MLQYNDAKGMSGTADGEKEALRCGGRTDLLCILLGNGLSSGRASSEDGDVLRAWSGVISSEAASFSKPQGDTRGYAQRQVVEGVEPGWKVTGWSQPGAAGRSWRRPS